MKSVQRFQVRTEDSHILDAVIEEALLDTTTDDDRGFRRIQTGGLKQARLADGRKLNRIDDQTFRIVLTGEVVTRV